MEHCGEVLEIQWEHLLESPSSQIKSSTPSLLASPSPRVVEPEHQVAYEAWEKILPSSSPSPCTDKTDEVAFEAWEKILIVVGADDEDYDHVPPLSWKKLWLFTRPGFLMSIAFLDPGNLEGDLQTGAIADYSLLWLLMWAIVLGLLIQMLSARVGVATRRHLVELCRKEYSNWARLVL
ncbi:hypothetical protein Tsubulata_000061 [Turnera subulata]|uniref:Uncharacterized protein n=1 Tax=Turnera subulata TaxID=218843 RepID=A0A9Q0FLF0_9ROSI|nr:hypothetical protein Tsubulata_000061 [Turnera subulata]